MVVTLVALADTGMKPDFMPVTLDMMLFMGTQGLSKVDCVTVWFFAWNWNCTHEPAGARILSGKYLSALLPFELDTCTTWTMTGPGELVPEGRADRVQLATALTAEPDDPAIMADELPCPPP